MSRGGADFKKKYQDSPGPHNRELVFEKMLKEVMLKWRKDELHRLFATDPAFKAACMQRMVGG